MRVLHEFLVPGPAFCRRRPSQNCSSTRAVASSLYSEVSTERLGSDQGPGTKEELNSIDRKKNSVNRGAPCPEWQLH